MENHEINTEAVFARGFEVRKIIRAPTLGSNGEQTTQGRGTGVSRRQRSAPRGNSTVNLRDQPVGLQLQHVKNLSVR